MFDPSKPTLKARLQHGPPFGVFWFALGNVSIIEAAVGAGAEAIVIDMQHGLFDRAALEAAIGIVPPHVPCMVRVEDDSAAAIGRALDAGAEGVIIPLIESGEQAARAVSACYYPPKGHRSGGGIRPLRQSGYMAVASDAIAVGLMIETKAGVSNCSAIAAIPNADFVFIGSGDLALSLVTEPGSPGYARACTEIFETCSLMKKPCGIFTMSPETAASCIQDGYRVTVVANDVSAVGNAFTSAVKLFKSRDHC
jgi:2-dehydro-3-deoxyglucarate aldolase/4-hydroxy-2-oxoheptanedioate aldolase